MMKNILISMGILALSASIFAGGDERDRAPIESLDAIAPATEQSTGNQALETMKFTVGDKSVSVGAYIACQSELGLSESNIVIFKKAQSGGYLYNTGPIDSLGTEFSPRRWDAYFDCVNAHNG